MLTEHVYFHVSIISYSSKGRETFHETICILRWPAHTVIQTFKNTKQKRVKKTQQKTPRTTIKTPKTEQTYTYDDK